MRSPNKSSNPSPSTYLPEELTHKYEHNVTIIPRRKNGSRKASIHFWLLL